MKNTWIRSAAALVALIVLKSAAHAQLPDPVLITDFSFFTSDQLYDSWTNENTVIDSGEDNYSITAKLYGSNYKYIAAVATGMTHLELEVTLSGPPEAEGLVAVESGTHVGPPSLGSAQAPVSGSKICCGLVQCPAGCGGLFCACS